MTDKMPDELLQKMQQLKFDDFYKDSCNCEGDDGPCCACHKDWGWNECVDYLSLGITQIISRNESEVKRLRDALEFVRTEVQKLEGKIRQKKGFYNISVGHDPVKQAHKAGTLKGLDIAHEEIKQTLTAIDAALEGK